MANKRVSLRSESELKDPSRFSDLGQVPLELGSGSSETAKRHCSQILF